MSVRTTPQLRPVRCLVSGCIGLMLCTTAALALAADTDATRDAGLPLWEFGLGLGGLTLPQYRGADQNLRWVLPVPYFVYRGDFFRSDREGTRAVLLDTESFDFDISVDGSPPVKSKDSRARTGMTDLAATLEVGPNVNITLGRGATWKLDLRVPLRAAFTVERRPQHIGWTLMPVLNLDVDVQGWNIGLQGGPLAADRRFHGYFYDVPAAAVIADRPAYSARAGYAGWGATTSASRRLGEWWLAAFARVDNVSGAAFEASPLVKQRSNFTVGFAVSWVFKTSETRVPPRGK
jgi:MipA family protein